MTSTCVYIYICVCILSRGEESHDKDRSNNGPGWWVYLQTGVKVRWCGLYSLPRSLCRMPVFMRECRCSASVSRATLMRYRDARHNIYMYIYIFMYIYDFQQSLHMSINIIKSDTV